MRRLTIAAFAVVSLLAQDRSVVPLGTGGRRVALVIGNDSYASLEKLANARNDARAVGDALRASGFEVTAVTDGKLEDMDRGVDAFVKSIQPKDVALFYYSGHAAEIDGQNLLIPVDLSADLDEIQVKNRSLRASEVLERMEGRSAALRIIVLDSCRTNPFRSMRGGGSGGLATMGAGRGTFIAYASAPGQAASDNRRGGNGLYTSYLIEALRTPGLELQRVFATAAAGTEEGSGGRQVPWISHSVRGEFFFLPGTSRSPNQAGTEDDLRSRVEGLIAINEAVKGVGLGLQNCGFGGVHEDLAACRSGILGPVETLDRLIREANIGFPRIAVLHERLREGTDHGSLQELVNELGPIQAYQVRELERIRTEAQRLESQVPH